MAGLTGQEIAKIVYQYIGVDGGYLGNFSYKSHAEFYPLYCDLDIDPNQYQGTTRERFIFILRSQSPANQAKIVRGVIQSFPVDQVGAPITRTQALQEEVMHWVERLEQKVSIGNPTPQITSVTVEQALTDAKNLLQTSGAASAVDRVHTALHGYLREVCNQTRIDYEPDASINRLLKLLRQQHPALQVSATRDQDTEKMLNALGTILDALNALRNHASLAHANPSLLGEEEAVLAVNATRSILHYLDGKFSKFRDDMLSLF